jgi:hypothetical protein
VHLCELTGGSVKDTLNRCAQDGLGTRQALINRPVARRLAYSSAQDFAKVLGNVVLAAQVLLELGVIFDDFVPSSL